MWVEITDRGEESYLGQLLNEPTLITDLVLGGSVPFKADNVIRVEDDRWAAYENQVAFVSARLLTDETLEPTFVVHDPVDAGEPLHAGGPSISGWQLLVGDETQEELDNPDTLKTPALNWLMERYRPFGELVFSGVSDGEWVLEKATSTFVPDGQ